MHFTVERNFREGSESLGIKVGDGDLRWSPLSNKLAVKLADFVTGIYTTEVELARALPAASKYFSVSVIST